MNTHVSPEIKKKYFNYEFRGKRFRKNNKTLIRAKNIATDMRFHYSFEEDVFWLS